MQVLVRLLPPQAPLYPHWLAIRRACDKQNTQQQQYDATVQFDSGAQVSAHASGSGLTTHENAINVKLRRQ